jgi:hypothetical protein
MSAIENGRGGSGYAAPAAINADGYEFRLTAVPSVLGDALPIRQSPDISELRYGLQAIMNGGDFERLGLSEREKVEVRTPFGSARAEAGSDTAIPQGMILLRHLSHASGLSLIRSGVDGMPAAVERINR